MNAISRFIRENEKFIDDIQSVISGTLMSRQKVSRDFVIEEQF